MTENTSERFGGVDIAKSSLDLHIEGQPVLHLAYDDPGIQTACARFREATPTLIVMEATGGLETRLATELSALGLPVAVVNLEGRVFMSNLDCPFRAVDAILTEVRQRTPVVLVDFHAETTSEKGAMGAYLDGRVSAVLGTHTHVQTADERVLPGGTAFISDAGMTGSRDSVIGIRKELSLERFLTQLPVRYEVAKREPMLCGVLLTVAEETGRATAIERVQIVDPE